MKRNTLEAKARTNLLTTSNRCMRLAREEKRQFLAVVKGSSATLRARLIAVVSKR